MMAAESEREALFLAAGLAPKFVKGFVKGAKSDALAVILSEAGVSVANPCPNAIGALLLRLVEIPPTPFAVKHRPIVAGLITESKLNSTAQIEAALRYLDQKTTFDMKEFEKLCGIGVVVTEEDIKKQVADVIEANKAELVKERYQFNLGILLRNVRENLPWADGKLCKQFLDSAVLDVLGPRTEEDEANAKSKKKSKAKEPEASKSSGSRALEKKEESEQDAIEYIMKTFVGRDLPDARNPPELLEQHNKITGGKIRTRFPPEPNGFLHIGHAKAMNFNFGIAKRSKGSCFLRFDDTNPSAEKKLFIDNIVENVKWLGHVPTKITYSSSYFPELYEMAKELIRRGKAYVCHQTQREIKEYRKKKNKQDPSPWRDRSVEENLRLFEDMKKGKFAEGAATLRMKMDITSTNPCMWDQVAYRIKYEPHPHLGDEWCIYPSYDYSHCLIDSLEHITHSLCSLEFEIRRDSYYWLLAALDLYRPMVWEYSRLNITHNVMSKRKLKYLVTHKYVRDWDDPRFPTVNGLRRRGFSASVISEFCTRVGVSRSSLVSFTSYSLLEACARDELNEVAPRGMAVLDPLKVTISNWPEGTVEEFDAPNFPGDASKGTHKVSLSNVFYIDSSDYRKNADKNFYGLSLGKTVHLKYAYNVTCDKVVEDEKGQVLELIVTVDKTNAAKVKGNIHFVSGKNPLIFEARVFDHLFSAEKPGLVPQDASATSQSSEDQAAQALEAAEEEEVEDALNEEPDWIKELNPNSETIYSKAMVDASFKNRVKAHLDKFQFERVGYFAVDFDSDVSGARLVMNQIVSLKADKKKSAE